MAVGFAAVLAVLAGVAAMCFVFAGAIVVAIVLCLFGLITLKVAVMAVPIGIMCGLIAALGVGYVVSRGARPGPPSSAEPDRVPGVGALGPSRG